MSKEPRQVFSCGTCDRSLAVKICKTNKNGNAGRAFTNCYRKNTDGTSCNFFAWVDPNLSPPSSRFASSSPPSSPITPPPAQSTSALIATQKSPSSLVYSMDRSCANSGQTRCNKPRHSSCERHMCRCHCVEAGGCQGAKSHTPAFRSDKGKQRAVASSSFTPPSPLSSPPPSWDNTTTNKSTGVDMFANPRYASQMTAAFTKQHAIEQALEEQLRAVDAERLANLEKAKNHVIIYAWPKVRYLQVPTLQCLMHLQ